MHDGTTNGHVWGVDGSEAKRLEYKDKGNKDGDDGVAKSSKSLLCLDTDSMNVLPDIW